MPSRADAGRFRDAGLIDVLPTATGELVRAGRTGADLCGAVSRPGQPGEQASRRRPALTARRSSELEARWDETIALLTAFAQGRLPAADCAGHYSIDAAERVVTAPDPVSTDLPPDKGHFSEPCFQHILRGLRTRIPDYVHDVLAGQPPLPAIADKVGGIVVVRC
jgi:hypothetical protein